MTRPESLMVLYGQAGWAEVQTAIREIVGSRVTSRLRWPHLLDDNSRTAAACITALTHRFTALTNQIRRNT